MSASSPTLVGENGSSSGYDVPGWCWRYICIVGAWPSGGVFMLALSMCEPSGRPSAVFGAVVGLGVDGVTGDAVAGAVAQLEVAGRLGEADRRAEQVVVPVVDVEEHLRAFWARLACQENGTFGSHEHG